MPITARPLAQPTARPQPEVSPIVNLEAVVSAVGGFPVLAGVDLVVEQGEFVVVTGPNGAGKTSLLQLIAGLLPVTSGRASVLGSDLASDRRSHRRQLAYVGVETFSYDDLTVASNLQLHARLTGTSPGRLHHIMELLGLQELSAIRHGQLSTGQRRRCALALALLRNVDLLLLDEPYSGLDAAARDVIDGAIRAMHRSGCTVLVSSHDLDRPLLTGRRLVSIRNGCVLPGS